MKLYRLLLLLLIPTLITLVSCGSDSDDSNDDATNEEETTGTTGTTTGTTTGDDGTSCMTASQKTNIRNLFDRAAGQSPFAGHATEVTRNDDGKIVTTNYPDSTVTVTKTSSDTWRTVASYCEGDMCIERDTIHSVAGTCYTSDTRVARITSSSSSRLSTRIDDNTGDPIIERSSYLVPTTGRANFSTVITRNGLRVNATTFIEDGSSSSSTTGTAETTGTSTGTTTGETVTSTGGFLSEENFAF